MLYFAVNCIVCVIRYDCHYFVNYIPVQKMQKRGERNCRKCCHGTVIM